MKQIFSFILCFIIGVIPHSTLGNSASVSATVNLTNIPPRIIEIIPGYSPIVVARNSIQNFVFRIQDTEGDTITYTITPDVGAVAPLSGTISNSTDLINAEGYINFTYLASNDADAVGISYLTITLNDGNNPIITQQIELYIY